MKLNDLVRKSDQEMAVELAARIAQKYSAMQYDEFEQEMKNITPKHLLPLMNLPQLFDMYNPERQQKGGDIWNRYMKDPNRIKGL